MDEFIGGNDPIKVIMLGDHGVGKTSLCKAIIQFETPDQEADEVHLPIFDNETESEKLYHEKNFQFEEETVRLQFWDIPKGENHVKLPNIYFHNTKVALICFDLTDKKSFENVRKWIGILDERASDDEVNIGLIACKADKEAEQQVTFEEVQNLNDEYGGFIQYVSSIKEKGIFDLLELVCEAAFYDDDEEDGDGTTENKKLSFNFLKEQFGKSCLSS